MKLADMEPVARSWIPRLYLIKPESYHGKIAAGRQIGDTDQEIGKLAAIARSRSEAARRLERAHMLLAYREKPSFFAVGQRLGVHHHTVQRCVERGVGLWPAHGP
jgi:hypothetical protein